MILAESQIPCVETDCQERPQQQSGVEEQFALPNRFTKSGAGIIEVRWTKVFDRTEIVSVTSVEWPHGVRRQARTSCCLTEASVLRDLRDVL